MKIFRKSNLLFTVVVLIPALLAISYYGFIASDQFSSESKFVIRNSESIASTGLGVLLKQSSLTRSQDDSYTVQEYIMSRDALLMLDKELNLKIAFSNEAIDILSRFPTLEMDDSFESLYKFYLKKISVQTDSASGITVLTTRTFDAKLAQKINQSLLESSEKLINRLNARAREDLVKHAQEELQIANKRASASALALAKFRTAQNILDPEKQASNVLSQLNKLQDEQLAATAQISQLKLLSPSNPQIPALANRIQVLEKEVEKEMLRITGSQKSLVNKASEYIQLQTEQDFANRQLTSAFSSLEAARSEAQKKQVYLERISNPIIADSSREPARLRNILSTFFLAILAYGIVNMLLIGLREHAE